MFKSTKDDEGEDRDVYLSQDDPVLFAKGDLTEDIINVIFQQLIEKYQEKMFVNMRGIKFIHDCADTLY